MNKQDAALEGRGYAFSIVQGRFIVIACIVWPVMFCIVSFGLFIGLHEGKREQVRGYKQIPTISETGVCVPERLVFTYGLHLEALFLAILFFFIFVEYKNRIIAIEKETMNQPLYNGEDVLEENNGEVHHTAKRFPATSQEAKCYYFCHCFDVPDDSEQKIAYLNFWNEILLVLGLLAAFFMSLVGTVTLGIESTVHTVLAGLMFLAGVLHEVLLYYTIADSVGYQLWQLHLHRVCLFMTIPFNLICIVIIALMWVYCTEGICVQAAVDFIPALEYQTFIFLLAYIFRFYCDVQHIHLLSADKRCEHALPTAARDHRSRVRDDSAFYNEDTKEAPGTDRVYTPPALSMGPKATTYARSPGLPLPPPPPQQGSPEVEVKADDHSATAAVDGGGASKGASAGYGEGSMGVDMEQLKNML